MEEAIMTASILARALLALSLAAGTPAVAAATGACEHAVAKASTKFVGSAFKIGENCIARATAAHRPMSACRLATGGGSIAAALGHAQRELNRDLGACSDVRLESMGFDSACASPGASAPVGRAGLQSCIARTHIAAVQTLLNVEFPQLADTCGDGVLDDIEDCDPNANPTGCDSDETCVAAGLQDECTCVPSSA